MPPMPPQNSADNLQVKNMKKKAYELLKHKNKTIPILSFPSSQLLKISVRELISSSDMMVQGMKSIAEKYPIGAAVSMMDLSVEAECFGAKIRFFDDDVPTVEKGIIEAISEAKNICVPAVTDKRTGIFIEGIKKAKTEIPHIPVFCGVIGPYSLAGRLFDMTELMLECFDNPGQVKILLEKSTQFIKNYAKALKEAGADGVILAEPTAGLLSPSLAQEFSMPYIQEIFNELNDEDFLLCYHNCGNSAQDMLKQIAELDADIIHLGNTINMKKALEALPDDKIVMGNVSPVFFRTKAPDDIKNEVQKIFENCSEYENFMISTGCDLPAESKWENINAYFEKINELY